MLSFVLLFSTLSQSIVATTVYAGNILMMEQDSELPVKEDQADITDQDHQEKNTDTENTNSNNIYNIDIKTVKRRKKNRESFYQI